jgi:hypothetical protein
MRRIFAIAFLAGCAHIAFAADTLSLQRTSIDQLGALDVGANAVVDGFPDGYGGHASIRFKRIDVYAPGARIIVVGPDGEHEVPRSTRIQLIGSDASGDFRAHLAFDPGFKNVVGAGSSYAGAFSVFAESDASGTRLIVKTSQEALPAGITPEVIPSEDGIPSGHPIPDPLTMSLSGDVVAGTLRNALVAVDVDHELLVNRFGGVGPGNVTAATNWISDLFATMNVMYERDLNVTLQQGTTRYRTGATPYVIAPNTGASTTDLNNFGTYWQNNESGVPRDFALLLSGQLSGGFSAAGIAWINAYCENQSSGGSYSVNKVFTSSQVPVDLSARIVGHELGHNFGAAHTHCTSATNGNTWPVASNTIDVCFKGESGSGCYAGPVSCPVAGPGHPNGSLMSYCNQPATNGANCGQNVLQFHPTQITSMLGLIASHTPSCLSVSTDVIFKNGFD